MDKIGSNKKHMVEEEWSFSLLDSSNKQGHSTQTT